MKQKIHYIGYREDSRGKIAQYVESIVNEKNGFANGVVYNFGFINKYPNKEKGWFKVVFKGGKTFSTNGIIPEKGSKILNVKKIIENKTMKKSELRQMVKEVITEESRLEYANKLKDYLQKNINAPWFSVIISTLGGQDRASVMVKTSLDNAKDWPSGIIQNSRFAFFHLNHQDKLELFRSHYSLPKMRKANYKSPQDAAKIINKYLASADGISKK